ncbi:MAG: alpha/beta fold hydrolase [Actinomycetes bacterium]
MPLTTTGAGVEIWFERTGSGPRLLVINGTGSDLRTKPNILDSPWARAFDLVSYDHRDLGRSTRVDAQPSMADYAHDAAGVLEAVGWDRCAVIGISFGGMVAQELAIRHPDRVERLALLCTSSGGAGGSSYPLHELEGLDEDRRAQVLLAINDTRYDEAWQHAHPTEAAELVDLVRAARTPMSAKQLEARRRHDAFDRLGRISAPTLVAAGRHDGIAPLANAEALVAAIPGARLEVFEGGHAFLIQDRDAFRAVAAFVGGDPGSG